MNDKAQKAYDGLKYLAKYITNPVLYRAALSVIENPDFQAQVGSSKNHHAYTYGLMIHTYEVTKYAVGMADMMPGKVDYDVLVTAAIFHDFCKIKEYKVMISGEVFNTRYRKLVRHVAGSHAAFLQAIGDAVLNGETVVSIEHAILAHHGRLEHGSPVVPLTLEAYILHAADMLSAQHFE